MKMAIKALFGLILMASELAIRIAGAALLLAFVLMACHGEPAERELPYAIVAQDWCAANGQWRTFAMFPDPKDCLDVLLMRTDYSMLGSDWNRQCTEASEKTALCVGEQDPRVEQSFLRKDRRVVQSASGIRIFQYN
ncbi:MAG: hypothetical protein WAU89_23345 [Candidatus Acidiferrales bacterium]